MSAEPVNIEEDENAVKAIQFLRDYCAKRYTQRHACRCVAAEGAIDRCPFDHDGACGLRYLRPCDWDDNHLRLHGSEEHD